MAYKFERLEVWELALEYLDHDVRDRRAIAAQ
jgi:hypothetical protein